MQRIWHILTGLTAAIVALVDATAAMAQQPQPWSLGFQPPFSPVMERIEGFHDFLLVIITLITVFVLGLLLYVLVRFRASANPEPSRTTHNTLIEVIWTAVPVMILVIIAVPSFQLLYFQAVVPESEMTVKSVGHQWYWSYEYPDQGNFTFDSYMIPDDDLAEGQIRNLSVDNPLVLPVDTTIRVIVTAADVLHNFAMPSLGVKMDAVPGRLNEIWVRIEEEGTYYGQCSELCGANHAYMPIEIKAVSREAYDAWAEQAPEKFARLPGQAGPVVRLADEAAPGADARLADARTAD